MYASTDALNTADEISRLHESVAMDVVLYAVHACVMIAEQCGDGTYPDLALNADNGPDSTKMIIDELSDCKTIIWNGPMGVFEMEKFAAGTFDVAKALAECTSKGAITIIGGGDSVAAVEKAGLADKMSHISTGGGASLELLEGLVLPGVAALDGKGGAGSSGESSQSFSSHDAVALVSSWPL